MSWIQKLHETYNNCEEMIGAGSDDNEVPLLPICHTTQKAHIEITIDENGSFLKARPLKREEARTIIPCTESSGGRTSGKTPHPLCDKLQYVAGDYAQYGGEKDPCFRLNDSAYDKNQIETEYFNEECENVQYRLINDLLRKYKKIKPLDFFNEIIKISNLVDILNKNERIEDTYNVISEGNTIIQNKNRLIEIFPETLQKTVTYEYLIERWCQSPFGHKKAKAVLKYIKKGNVIKDLIDYNVLIADNNKRLIKTWDGDKKAKPLILTLFQNEQCQADAFIRWAVEIPNDPQSSVYADPEIWKSWIQYYSQTKQNKSLCYVTGQEEFSADQHPAKLRSDGDKAKIISSNDLSGFTFLGRFLNAEQATSIGFKVTQKAHFALRWLIDQQGYKGKDGQVIVAWATSGAKIPQPTDDPLNILGFNEIPSNESKIVSTAQELALKLKKKIAGYNKDLGDTTDVVVMGLDSATTGRMSITFYKELTGSDFLNRINSWHNSSSWIHQYGFDRDSKHHFTFVGAPAPVDIAEAAYGSKADDKLKKATVARILPCIIDSQPIPRDIVESAVRRACNRIALKNPKDKFEREWNKTLSIACSLYKKYSKEEYNMELDENRTTRDYLYGCLLAIADRLEGYALYKANEKRETNAARFMQLFAEHPFKTWRQIELALSPYKARLGGAHYYTSLIDEVMCKFAPDDFKSDKPLSGEFLLGYHCQRAELFKKTKDEEPEEIEDDE